MKLCTAASAVRPYCRVQNKMSGTIVLIMGKSGMQNEHEQSNHTLTGARAQTQAHAMDLLRERLLRRAVLRSSHAHAHGVVQ